MAALFGIEPLLEADVRTLSGGEQQRVALARALAVRPDLLVLDEPTASLDVTMKRTFRDDMARARTQAGSVVLITHDPAEAFGLADRIAVLDGGRIVQQGTPEDVLNGPQTAFVASFAGAELLLDGVVAAVADELLQIDAGGAHIWAIAAPGWQPEPGMRAHVAYRPEDVTIAAGASVLETSARNQYRLRIASLSGSGALVRLRLDGSLKLDALLTRSSVEALSLRPGVEVIAQMKAAALHVLKAT
jgi:molybdate/tungstate transport system ATP-binding protein